MSFQVIRIILSVCLGIAAGGFFGLGAYVFLGGKL
jgi:hypothetical protein